jgi:3-oxoacyl-[acyl-carrier-protein] synthase II
LESAQHVARRGKRGFCKIVGYGASLNGCGFTDANHEGIARSMQAAIEDARISPDEIGYINAHGTSTISNDKEETIAIKNIFKERAYKIPVNSTKSMIGHSFAAGGAIESAVCVKSLLDQKVHPTLNFREGDDICDLNYVKNNFINCYIKYCMNNSSGIGGYNATLVFSKL